MIIENALSRVFLGVHWIFDAFDFTQDSNGTAVPNLNNEQIGGVGLGLRIARDIFTFGSGLAPRMTPPNAAIPPIMTPNLNTPMPAVPKQPASVAGCVGPAMVQPAGARGAQDVYPPGSVEQGTGPTTSSGAWPSGISEK